MKISTNAKAGLFMFIAIFLLALGILTLGKERHIFSAQSSFMTAMYNVGGLSTGAPVRLGGITVGRVEDISFSPDQADPRVHIEFSVEDKYLSRIRHESIVKIETQGLLGDKYLSIDPGMMRSSEPPLEPGSYLEGKEPADFGQFLHKAQEVIDNTVEISQSVSDVLKQVKTETMENFSASLANFTEITDEIREGKGLVHRLIYSGKDADKIVTSVSNAAGDLEQIIEDLKSGEGLLHTLIYDPKGKDFVKSLDTAANNLSSTAAEIMKIASEIKDGSGIMHQLVYDESVDIGDKISKTVAKLENAASALNRASNALANGDGTIGALLVDSKLYDNLVEITDGAKRSFILRQAIKSSMSK